ncbi:OB-fold-containig protein [Flammeovirga sp. SJP92]|uniref:OB-fold-containig protein n=1 Tax=Flammeovirga sp. SJP92 TaxID=1775430 RepID=UPI0009EECB21|nr:OB-fold-containig protein [Flammeovirga sp. SJP92]
MELLNESINLVNLPYTFLVVICLFYWLNVMVGVLSPDTLDLELDSTVDLDADIDHDIDDVAVGHGVFATTAEFLFVGKVPLMIIITVLSTLMWVFSVFGNHYFGNTSGVYALMAFLPILIVSIFLSRFFVYPFALVFKKLNHEVDREIVGKVSKVVLPASNVKKGQATVLIGNAEQKIYIKTSENSSLFKGDEAMVIEYDSTQKCYLVEPI